MTNPSPEKDPAPAESIPFYPNHVRSEAKVVIGITALVVLVGLAGLFLPVGVGAPADPLNTPTHVKPEWYFLALYQMLKFLPKTIGAVLPVLALLLVAVWPFIDHKQETSPRLQRIRLTVVVIGLILLAALTIWGEAS
jgi:quinol-cytochrome oxidoreductase complex cytochrome b subunit